MNSTASISKTRYPHLDLLRMIAIYLVILLHCMAPYCADARFYGTHSWWCFLILNGFCRASVPLFLMISGFLTLNGPPIISIREFYRKKIRRLLVPFLFWDVVYFFLACYNESVTPTVSVFLRELVNRGSEYHLWFVYELTALYLLAPFLKKLTEHCSDKELWGLLLLVLTPTAILPLINTIFSVYIAPLPVLFEGYVGYFLFGYLLQRTTLTRKQRCLVYLGALVGLLINIIGNNYFSSEEGVAFKFNSGYLLNRYLVAAGLFVLMRQLTTAPGAFLQKLCGLGRRLSKISYGIYLVHVMILELYTEHALPFSLAPAPELLLTAVIVATITTAVCILLSHIPVARRLVT